MRNVYFSLVLCLNLLINTAQAQGFSALVSPPRVETNIKSGQTTRQVLEISQVGPLPGRFRIYTNDWALNANGSVDFFDDLQPNSCRPWVSLEKRDLTVAGNARMRFRYEITPPADAVLTECRFAIMLEGLDTSNITPGNLNFPVSGRIAVIVYAAMPGAKATMTIVNQVISQTGNKLPVLQVSNTGSAHGRVQGLLAGTDAKGKKLEFIPNTLPVLPGETRSISLSANLEGGADIMQIDYPITIKGTIELGAVRQSYEHTFKIE